MSDQDSNGPDVPDHKLIRIIGQGSYGQVWLAHNPEADQWRAVKVIHRNRFKDCPKEFDREFTGLRKYEPISRDHPGLVDVLHVGRARTGDYFYYVMELADDAERGGAYPPMPAAADDAPMNGKAPVSDAQKYKPRTLREELKRQGHLPVRECVDIGIKLAEALEYLHGPEHKMVHRDIKPSNVIFVRDHPKLADIGLLTRSHSDGSDAGTLGYVDPDPEGRGTPLADIYALGKVLYETATGEDHLNFPRLPWFGDRSGSEQNMLRKLKAVFFKACEPDRTRRQQTAAELRRDLEMVRDGLPRKKIKQTRFREKTWKIAKRAAWVAAIFLLLGGFWIVKRVTPSEPWAVREFGLPDVRTWSSAMLGQLNNGGPLELFVRRETGDYIAVDTNGTAVNERQITNRETPWSLQIVCNYKTNDPNHEMIVQWSDRNTAAIRILNQNGAQLAEYSVAGAFTNHPKMGPCYAGLHPQRFARLEQNQREKLLAIFSMGWMPPRGIACFDAANGSPDWSFHTAPAPTEFVLMKINDDSVLDLVLGSNSISNSVVLTNGTSDTVCYLYAIDGRNGDELWRQKVGTHHTKSKPFLVPGAADSPPRLYAWITREEEVGYGSPEVGRIVEFDPFKNGNPTNSYDIDASLLSCLVADRKGDGKYEILVTDRRGRLHVLDPELQETCPAVKVVKSAFSSTNDAVHLFLDAVTNVVSGSAKQLVLHSRDVDFLDGNNPGNDKTNINNRVFWQNTIHLLSSDFKPLATNLVKECWRTGSDPGWWVQVVDWDGDGVVEIISLADKVRVLQYRGKAK